MTLSYAFTNRVRAHPRILSQPANKASAENPLVLAVADQLLVTERAASFVVNLLSRLNPPIQAVVGASVFAGLHTAPDPDVYVIRLRFPNTKAKSPNAKAKTRPAPALGNVAQVARYLRGEVGWGEVSPNHVLLPAPVGHGCPYGPPSPRAERQLQAT